MRYNNISIEQIHDNLFEIPQTGAMRVPARIYASRQMMHSIIDEDESIKQVINVAHLPGIQKYSLGMPDIHWGYGFPIGGVAATDVKSGVISPGGVGYDINCGVRLAKTGLDLAEVTPKIKELTADLFNHVPTGVGSEGAIKKLTASDLKQVFIKGSEWAIEHGFGKPDDLEFTEEKGCLRSADPDAVSTRAIERGRNQIGTLGSGNHFLEIDVVDAIYDPDVAQKFGLYSGQIVVLIHTGSRGCGYQVCDDYLKEIGHASATHKINLPDRQLACAPISSPQGSGYLGAMASAANYAWTNRQVIMHLARQSFKRIFMRSESELQFELLYDVCHNIAKIEEHEVDGKLKKLCLHRKGATRAFAPGSKALPVTYREVGQPVLVPGDMGRYSFVCVGTAQAMNETFGSTCHGAGRLQSRKRAKKTAAGRDLFGELKNMGVEIQARGRNTVAEEMPYAYKDVATVVDVMHQAGISRKVVRLKPIGVIKG